MFKETYYQSIREYMPQDAQAALDRQIPMIRQQIQQEVAGFGERLATYIQETIAAETKRQDEELGAAIGRMKGLLSEIKSAPDATKADRLRDEIEAFEKRYRGLGESVRKVITTGLDRALPGISSLLPKE